MILVVPDGVRSLRVPQISRGLKKGVIYVTGYCKGVGGGRWLFGGDSFGGGHNVTADGGGFRERRVRDELQWDKLCRMWRAGERLYRQHLYLPTGCR